jgi:serine/threonine protein kinase
MRLHRRLRRCEEGQGQAHRRACGNQGALRRGNAACCASHPPRVPRSPAPGLLGLQVVDKSRYAAGDNSLEREIQVLIKVRHSQGKDRAFTQEGSLTQCALQVDHPNCIRLFDVYITPRKVYLVTELVTGGELLDRWAWRRL